MSVLRAVTSPISILAISAAICVMLRDGNAAGAGLSMLMTVAMIADVSSGYVRPRLDRASRRRARGTAHPRSRNRA